MLERQGEVMEERVRGGRGGVEKTGKGGIELQGIKRIGACKPRRGNRLKRKNEKLQDETEH